MVETPGGELAIWWNGHHLLQIGISHGGMPSRGSSFWIPLALSMAHWPSVLLDPRVYFGFARWQMSSLLSHLCPPWSYYYFLKSPKPLKCFQITPSQFCGFRMTKMKKEGGRGHVLVTGCGTAVPFCYGSSACGLSFLAHQKASPSPHADRRLVFDSSLVSCLSQAIIKQDA